MHDNIIIIGGDKHAKLHDTLGDIPERYKVEWLHDDNRALNRIYENSFSVAIFDIDFNINGITSVDLVHECIKMGKSVILLSERRSILKRINIYINHWRDRDKVKFVRIGSKYPNMIKAHIPTMITHQVTLSDMCNNTYNVIDIM